MNTINMYIERAVLNGSSVARVAIHLLMVIERKQSIKRGMNGIGREIRTYLTKIF